MMTEREWLEQKVQEATKDMPLEGPKKAAFDVMMKASKEAFLEGILASVGILSDHAEQVNSDIEAGKVEKDNEYAARGLVTTCLVAGQILVEFHRAAKAYFDNLDMNERDE